MGGDDVGIMEVARRGSVGDAWPVVVEGGARRRRREVEGDVEEMPRGRKGRCRGRHLGVVGDGSPVMTVAVQHHPTRADGGGRRWRIGGFGLHVASL